MLTTTTLNAPAPRLLYAKKEAAYQLSISVRSLNYLIAEGRINVRRIGGWVLVPYSELIRFSRHDRYDLLAPEKNDAALGKRNPLVRSRRPQL
jgi:hypothetical protein